MADITAEQLLRKVRNQAGRIAELELANDAYAIESAQLRAELEAIKSQVEAREIAGEIVAETDQKKGAKPPVARPS